MTETKSRYVLTQVKKEHIGPISRHIMPLIKKACDHSGGRFNPECVFENCAGLNPRQQWYLWVVFDPEQAKETSLGESVLVTAVTSLADYPTGLRIGETILIGGHGPSDQWLEHIDGLQDWAKSNGAERMQYIGRRGWQRQMRSMGIDWKPVMTMYESEIGGDDGGR